MAQETKLGNNLLVTLTIGNFVLDGASTSELGYSIVIDLAKSLTDHGPELKFNMIEYVVHRMLEELHDKIIEETEVSNETYN